MSVDSGDGHSEQWSLVPQLRGGDPRELAYLYDNYAAYLFDYCEDILRDTGDAADAVRDTLVAAYASIGALADQERLRSWLYAIARRQWPAYSRQPAAAAPGGDDGDQQAVADGGPDISDRQDFPAGQVPIAGQPDVAGQPEDGGRPAGPDQLTADDQPEGAGRPAPGGEPGAADQLEAGDEPGAADQHGIAGQQRVGEHPYPPVAGSEAAGSLGTASTAAHPPSADPADPPGTADLAKELAAALAAAAARNGLTATAAEDGLAATAADENGEAHESELAGYDTDEFDALTPEDEQQEREAREQETMTVVATAFDGLAGPDREVLNLAYRHGIIGTDLAVTTGLADRQVRARLTEAVSHFSQAADVIIILYLGWTRCRALEQIAGDWDPASARLDHELLAALTRHAARCQRCRHSSGYTVYGPDLLASIPLTMPPDGLRRQVIATAHDAGLDEYRAEVVGRLGALGPDGFPLPAGRRRLRSHPPGPPADRQAARQQDAVPPAVLPPAGRQDRRRLPLAAAAISAVAAAVIVAGFLVFRLVTTSGPAPAQPAVPLQAADASPGSQLAGSGQSTPSGRGARPQPRSSTGLPPGLLGPTQPIFTPVPPEPQPTQAPSPHRSPSPGNSKSPQPSPTVPPPPPTSSPSPTPTPTGTPSAAPPA
ncbi:MAG TPA: sigma factor [Streptosporangiaceae bacterium]